MTDQTMVERIKALGVHEGTSDPVTVIKDTFSVLATLIQSDEYCWCQAFPCECVMVLFDDLTECVEARYPELGAARLAAEDELGADSAG